MPHNTYFTPLLYSVLRQITIGHMRNELSGRSGLSIPELCFGPMNEKLEGVCKGPITARTN